MRKLDREAVTRPKCLLKLPKDTKYTHLGGQEKQEIRSALLQMQDHRCAYCERRTGDERDDGHIEHFRKQADNPKLDVIWENMFWSCNDEKTCGKRKDKCVRPGGLLARFNPSDLLDPSLDDPNDFFIFVSDGTITLKDELSALDQKRAKETLRVFQLADSALLRKSREDAVRPYKSAVLALVAAAPEFVGSYIRHEREKAEKVPFSAAILQFFDAYS